jgi:hypothetical protein
MWGTRKFLRVKNYMGHLRTKEGKNYGQLEVVVKAFVLFPCVEAHIRGMTNSERI